MAGDEAILVAADELASALAAVTEVDDVPLGGYLADLWPGLAHEMLSRWAADLRRTAARAVTALDDARSNPLSDDGVDAVERATWRLAGVRDKLRAIASLALGVQALRLDRPGVRFAPSYEKIARRLVEIGSDDALRLRDLFDQIAEHPAIALRNQVSHSLSPVKEVAELCWLDMAILDEKNGIIGWDTSKTLYPEHLGHLDSIDPETVYAFSVATTEEALALVEEAVAMTAAVVREHGKIYGPYKIYKDRDGRVHIDRPPGLGPSISGG